MCELLSELKNDLETTIERLKKIENGKCGYHINIAKEIKRKRTLKGIKEVMSEHSSTFRYTFLDIEEWWKYLNKIKNMELKEVKEEIISKFLQPYFEEDKRKANENRKYLETKLEIVNNLISIVKKNDLEVSKSPHSDSYYAFKKGEYIGWEYKPECSYRLSDHWSFTSEGVIHCPSDEIDDNELALGVFKNGKYYKVKIQSN